MNNFHIFTTGGTIDKIYFDAKNDYHIGEPIISQILHQAQVQMHYEMTSLMRKDSLELTDSDREIIRNAVIACPSSHVLITHGTDTMVKTGLFLKDLTDKIIVLTGALSPARFQVTDAIFNIGCALGALQTLANGVWIAMNGKIFPIDRVRKNIEKNCFEEIELE